MSAEKHALIVGGTRGVGRSLVASFQADGFRISVIGKREAYPEDFNSMRAKYYTTDLQNKKTREQVLKKIIIEQGKINYLIFFQRYRGLEDSWLGEFELSLTVTKEIIEILSHDFSSLGDKSIVIMSSIASQFIASEQPVSYHVAKAGLIQLAKFYAVKLGPHQIRVNCISSGTVIKGESQDFYRKNKKLNQLYRKIIPLGRICSADEIASVARFLCSSNSSFITGQNLIVDGGLSLQWHESLARQLSPLKNLKVSRNSKR